ncbi:MAG: GNAT family N-acetyltransferase [Proteobacteria bacterium]|jgi:GNAT superfamily N-acetyltransferase|nr:GNAT family N-acetyltransferase [Alphaproteobacteria bacterium]NCC02937.1 GNAT family N-acetyltransferase [Pseudomonadota bacterium]
MKTLFFDIKDHIDPEEDAFLLKGLIANALERSSPPYSEQALSIIVRDDAGHIIAGLTGKTFWNWLYIDTIWVEKEQRKSGLGRQLVEKAEREAITRGCHSAYLWTEDFEGEGFYPKLGYQQFVEKADFPNGHRRIGFMKRIAA